MSGLQGGRASVVSDLGDGRVLRRGGHPRREAEVMAHAGAHGFPVPRVLEVRQDALVLERVEGPTMLADLRRRPWRVRRHARSLALLHRRLHEIPYRRARLVHFDLHPANVILSPGGPVVIDWTNARAGDPAVDVALTWLIAMTSAGPRGRAFARAYARHVGAGALDRGLAEAAALRLADPHVSDPDRLRIRELVG